MTEAGTARIAPAEPPFPPEVQAVLDRLPAAWAPPFVLFTTLARDTRLFRRFTAGSLTDLERGHLTLRQREVLLDRVTALCRCEYEWGLRMHYYAEAAGLTEAQIRSTVHGSAEDPCWEEGDRVLIRLADALHADCDADDELWRELQAAFSAEAIMELLMLAGFYRTVSYLANGLRLPPEPRVQRPFPQD
jgi:alkylhydroperoxidase family enzyme